MGFGEILTLILVVAKLTGHLSWSWLWVLAPVLVSWALGLFFVVVAGILTWWAGSR